MNVEGYGPEAPTPIAFLFSTDQLLWLSRVATDRDARRGYANSRGVWRHGLIDNTTFRGCVGEFACATWLSERLGVAVEIDTTDRPRGDDGIDLRVLGKTLQVKCRKRTGDAVLIPRHNDQRKILTLTADFYVQATWPWDGAQRSPLPPVTIDGWLLKRDVTGGRIAPARKGVHVNLEIPNRGLRTPADLVLFFQGLQIKEAIRK